MQKNISKFEKFRRNYSEYQRFKGRLQEEIGNSMDLEEPKGYSREQSDLRFTYEFVNSMIHEVEHIDIDIFSERTTPEGES